ncbi:MAE_28990/MAE_18760 family HEPN-like nuclease [Priestia megaterium]|uniref:MAE_28990/MAE_18760 family HEPN-like nuclease n=1 Tax=Priestia megaterium TaxID=1404 RepID=UPI002E1B73FF|nr:MAE_28990/MAE_18760 family HEPN-like nuclease [Priestia megaterium]MED4315402.1 MAE_28990/MAE_18760 family HEPN-like nuclease [Priestia megaterium]
MKQDKHSILLESKKKIKSGSKPEIEGLVESEIKLESEDELELAESAALEFLTLSEERWKEIDLLIDEINSNKEDEEIYNVLCRSTIVLMVAHLEGYVKEAASALIDDLKYNVSFSELPTPIKKTYVSSFLNIDSQTKSDQQRIKKLMDEFEKLNAEIAVNPFLFEQNKNPSPSIVEKVMSNFGVNNFFGNIHESKLDDVFKNDLSETIKLLEELRTYTLNAVKHFPYNIDIGVFNIRERKDRIKRDHSLWVTFLDELLQKRHSIAHGSNFTNDLSDSLLSDFRNKAQILQYAIALVLFNAGLKKEKQS